MTLPVPHYEPESERRWQEIQRMAEQENSPTRAQTVRAAASVAAYTTKAYVSTLAWIFKGIR